MKRVAEGCCKNANGERWAIMSEVVVAVVVDDVHAQMLTGEGISFSRSF